MEARRALIEVLERDGTVRAHLPVLSWPIGIGRAYDCDVVLDDPHVAPRHAEIAPDADGRLIVTALDTLNGVRLGKRKLARGEQALLPDDGRLQLGHTRLRVRHAGETLAPERVLAATEFATAGLTLVLGLLCAALFAFNQWLDAPPETRLSAHVPVLIGAPLGLLLWTVAWGLGSKLFQRHFVFLPHLRLALAYGLAIMLVDEALPGLAFASGWAWPSRINAWVQFALVFALVYAHLALVLPAFKRVMAWAIGAAFVLGIGASAAVNWQRHQRVFDELYTATIGPPALRLAPAVPVERFLDRLRGLKPDLDRRAAEKETDFGDEADTLAE